MKQTAVEFLLDMVIGQTSKGHDLKVKDCFSEPEINKVKDMEKEQIMQGYMEGLYYDKNSLYTPSKEQYYNETYKSE